MQTLQIDAAKARKLYPNATNEFKEMLVDSFGLDFFSQKITDRVKSYVDAVTATGGTLSEIPEFGIRHVDAYFQLTVIAEALNEGWKPNWNDDNERKYFPYFVWDKTTGGFVLDLVYYCSTRTSATSRLCFKTRELAEYAVKQFPDLFNAYLKM